MMPTVRQQLIKRRTLLGAVTLCCLLWHMLLPTMVHLGLVPALFAMPSHCQPAMIMSNDQHNSSMPMAVMLSVKHDHVMPRMTDDMMLGQMDHTQHSISNSMQPSLQPMPDSDVFYNQHAHEVFALAAKIMKHCPLCSHGLDSGVIIPLIALLFVVLAYCFTVVRSLDYKWIKRLSIPHISVALPFKHGPPVTL